MVHSPLEEHARRRPTKYDELPRVGERRWFRTVAGPGSAPYPTELSGPNVYYCERLKNYRPFADGVLTDTFEFVCNLSPEYIPEGSDLLCWQAHNRWWTTYRANARAAVLLQPDAFATAWNCSPGVAWTATFDDAILGGATVADVAWGRNRRLAVVGREGGGEPGGMGTRAVVALFTRGGELIWKRHPPPSAMSFVAVDVEGNVIASGLNILTGEKHLIKYDPAGNEIWSVLDPSITHLGPCAVDRHGRVWLQDGQAGEIKIFTPAGDLETTRELIGFAIAINGDGTYVQGGAVGVARKYTAAGDQLWEYVHGAAVNMVAVDKDGNVALGGAKSSLDGHNIRYLTPAGQLVWSATLNTHISGSTVRGVAFDRQRHVIVSGDHVDLGVTNLAKFSPSGTQWSALRLGGASESPVGGCDAQDGRVR